MNKEFEKIAQEIDDFYTSFKRDHDMYVEKGNMAAGSRARKALGFLKSKVVAYRKMSNEIANAMKSAKAAEKTLSE